MTEKGKRRVIWMPNELDSKAEAIRKQLGLSKSGFYRFAIVEQIKQFATAKKMSGEELPCQEPSTLPA